MTCGLCRLESKIAPGLLLYEDGVKENVLSEQLAGFDLKFDECREFRRKVDSRDNRSRF